MGPASLRIHHQIHIKASGCVRTATVTRLRRSSAISVPLEIRKLPLGKPAICSKEGCGALSKELMATSYVCAWKQRSGCRCLRRPEDVLILSVHNWETLLARCCSLQALFRWLLVRKRLAYNPGARGSLSRPLSQSHPQRRNCGRIRTVHRSHVTVRLGKVDCRSKLSAEAGTRENHEILMRAHGRGCQKSIAWCLGEAEPWVYDRAGTGGAGRGPE